MAAFATDGGVGGVMESHVEVAQKEAGKALGVPCFEEIDASNTHLIDRRGQGYREVDLVSSCHMDDLFIHLQVEEPDS